MCGVEWHVGAVCDIQLTERPPQAPTGLPDVHELSLARQPVHPTQARLLGHVLCRSRSAEPLGPFGPLPQVLSTSCAETQIGSVWAPIGDPCEGVT